MSIKNVKPPSDSLQETEPLLSSRTDDQTATAHTLTKELVHGIQSPYFNASNTASWLSTIFYLTSTVFGPLYGRISDVVGRRIAFTCALVIFTLTTGWCGISGSIGSLIAARAVCGLGAGGVISMSNVILSDIVKIEFRGIYQSFLNLAFGLGNGLGASLGGLLCDKLGWRGAFFLQVPLLLALTMFAAWITPPQLGPCLAQSQDQTVLEAMKTFDFAGAGALALTVAGFIIGINLGGNVLAWTNPLVITALIICVIAALALIVVERRALRPLLPLRLLSSVPFGNLNWGNTIGMMLSSTVLFNVPLFLQGVKLVSPTTSGVMLLSPLLGVSISSVLVGYYISWTRRIKSPVVAGVISMLIGTVACSCLTSSTPTVAVAALIPYVSIGQGFLFPTTTVSTLALSSDGEQAVVVTTLGLCRSIRAILGIAVSSWILQNALLYFLEQEVTGDIRQKEAIIARVRKSVRAVAEVDPAHRMEVTNAYSKSLQAMFLSFIILAFGLCLLLLPIHIPNLRQSSSAESDHRGRSDNLSINQEIVHSDNE